MYFKYPNMPFVTADPHYFHTQINDYCKRGFTSEKTMRHKLMENFNSVVPKDGTCFFIGDMAMVGTSQFEKITAVLKKLNGTKILVLGNHDECKPFRYVNCGFQSVHTSLSVQVELNSMRTPRDFVLSHDPCVWDLVPTGHVLLCGHVHNLFKILHDKDTINCGVDVWDFHPISFKKAFIELERMKTEAQKLEHTRKFNEIPIPEEVIKPDQETG